MQHDYILLDRSGSMASRWDEALSSINAYAAKLAEDAVDTGVTLVAFDIDAAGNMAFDTLRDRIVPATWRPVTKADASPRGGTPLNDATARIVQLAEAGGYDKVAIAILTDGEENSSREYKSAAAITEMLDRCRAKGWQVIMLGVDFNNAAQAKAYGNADAFTISASAGNLRGTMHMLGSKRTAYGKSGDSMSFTAAEKASATAPITPPKRGR